MAQLERAPDGLKMGELSRRLMVTGGNVTGIVDRLEREGLVARREPCPDRRTSYVAIDRPAAHAFDAMAREHEHWVDRAAGRNPGRRGRPARALLADLKHGAEAEAERAAMIGAGSGRSTSSGRCAARSRWSR